MDLVKSSEHPGAATALRRQVRVALVDDHPIVRASLRAYLEEHEDLQVVGEGASGREAIDLVRSRPVDVLLLDLEMPRQSGFDALAMILAKGHGLHVLVLSGFPEDQYAVPLIRKGASGFLNKSCPPWEIVAAIRKVAGGERYLPPRVADLLVTELMPEPARAPHGQLSDREFQVLIKLAQGRAPGEIARELCLSGKTVSTYRTKVLHKLDLRSNAELTYYALKHGLLD